MNKRQVGLRVVATGCSILAQDLLTRLQILSQEECESARERHDSRRWRTNVVLAEGEDEADCEWTTKAVSAAAMAMTL